MLHEEEASCGLLRRFYAAAVAAADPARTLAAALPAPPTGRCVVVGAGKSAAAMAAAVESAWPHVPLSGVVVTRDGHAVPAGRIEVIEASHPVPDHRSEHAARRILAAVSGLTADDLVLVLLSGGGSALMALPRPGLTLSRKQAITRQLLASGATIAEMNTIRRHLSAIKGGRLAQAAAPARVVTLAISDVPGDDPLDIASGPTVPDPAAGSAAVAVAARYGMRLPPGIAEAPRSQGSTALAPDFRLIATPAASLRAAAAEAARAGLTPLILGDALEGESREMARVMAGIAVSCRVHGTPAKPSAVLLSGGESTVTLPAGARGKGGRNTEFALALAIQLRGAPGITALAADTDGIDGVGDAAGAYVTPTTLARLAAAMVDPATALARHDSYAALAALADLLITGPTLTNVNDFRAILIA